VGLTLRPYCRGLPLDGFGVEASEPGSYVCSLDGRYFLVSFLVKEQRPCPVFKLQSAVGSSLEGNYQNRQPTYQTTAVHNQVSNWSPVYGQNTLYDPEVTVSNVKLLTLNVATVTITIHTKTTKLLVSNSPTKAVLQFSPFDPQCLLQR